MSTVSVSVELVCSVSFKVVRYRVHGRRFVQRRKSTEHLGKSGIVHAGIDFKADHIAPLLGSLTNAVR